LSERERLSIADGLLAGQSLRSIARDLGRSPSTIAREVANNADPATGRYRPYTAQRRSEDRRARPKPAKFVADPELAGYVQAGLDKHWSPEQISRTLPGEFPDRTEMRACHETIYQALYSPDRGGLHRHPAKVLRTRRARRKRRRRPEERRSRFGGPMTMICERPSEVADRSVPGHWEGDLIMGRGNRSAIGTLVERTTRFVKFVHLPGGHSGEEMKDAVVKTMSSVPAHLARSLTWDQGSEMACHDELTVVTGIPVYFCNPASPWQRGTNENTNGLARQYFPKGADLRAYDAEELEAVACELNSRPRKTLGWQTPADCYNEQLSLAP
jgi:IS30 family transposase